MSDQNKIAILVGSISSGFSIQSIVTGNAAAEEMLEKNLANGVVCDKLEVNLPSHMNPKAKDYEEGDSFLVFGSGLANGFEMYGPFPYSDLAESFGERYRREDEEWHIFSFTQPSEIQTVRER